MLQTLVSIFILQLNKLKTSLLICDGGAPNLAALKSTHGVFGAYGINPESSQANQCLIKPWFINPFNPPHQIFWLICPSHQVCNC